MPFYGPLSCASSTCLHLSKTLVSLTLLTPPRPLLSSKSHLPSIINQAKKGSQSAAKKSFARFTFRLLLVFLRLNMRLISLKIKSSRRGRQRCGRHVTAIVFGVSIISRAQPPEATALSSKLRQLPQQPSHSLPLLGCTGNCGRNMLYQ